MTSDQSAYGDDLLKSQTLYDGLGRVVEARQYESATAYISGDLINDSYSGYGSASGQQTRFYDAEGRMTAAQINSSQAAAYAYDADGRRIRRNVGTAGEVWQVYGMGGELLAEYAAGASPNAPQKEYGYRSGQLLVTATATGGYCTPPVIHDNPLVAGQTTVQSRHVAELRSAIDSLRRCRKRRRVDSRSGSVPTLP